MEDELYDGYESEEEETEFNEDSDDDLFESEFEPEPEELERIEGTTNEQAALAVRILKQVHESLGLAIEMLEGGEAKGAARHYADIVTSKKAFAQKLGDLTGARVVEGVFSGRTMVGSDGKQYDVPPNYASKSRLVDGDVMKLTIKPDGTFIFKQIRPVERKRVVGDLAYNEACGEYVVVTNKDTYRVLTASVTYFKGEPGDEVTLLVPKSGSTEWGAVDNILKG